MNTPITAFDTAYPGSMTERNDGYYLRRDDHKSLAVGLVELIASRDREIEDLRASVESYQRLLVAAPNLLDALKELRRAYVNLLESGRDHIVSLGGQCDDVTTMEAADPFLSRAVAAIAKAEQP